MTETRIWFRGVQAAEYADCHPDTVRRAAEAGELHGYQRRKLGHWRYHRDCLDAWLAGEKCKHGMGRAAA